MRRYRIGRADTNDIVLADATVSREHAEFVELGGGRFQIKDLGSTYGVAIWQGEGWQKVTEIEVRHDSQLRIGDYQTTVADLLRDTDRTAVRPRASEPPPPVEPSPPPIASDAPSAEATATPPPTSAARTAPPRPPAPAFQFLRNLPPEKRILVWLGAGFAAFLFIAFVTLILALVL
jgi:hypothetical protein